MKPILSIFVITAAVTVSYTQTRTFKWDSEMCSFTGTYNSKRYNEKQLRDTARLLAFGQFELTYFPMVFKYSDIETLDVAKLDDEYAKRSADLKSLDLVPGPYWENVRQKRIKEIDQAYSLRKAQTLAYRDPKALRDYKAAPNCNARFAESLIAGGDSLYKVWLEVNIDSRKKNADPERLRREFESQMASADRDKFALVEVMGFGWGNCANELIEYDEAWRNGDHQKQFKKLFVRLKESCEEP